ncbi:NitT/TauT family transport system substrate-binding protein [Thermoanaerobacterium sp. RBIITD]|nr:aliphatic sulfonate ABC transporter substrate-binding protein [Thermoanaerobacterium sp. RBIITD]SNX54759.1 NitT/TauT family transport system substrate-binding protein [Thermoanaerobacterium sp. RBIITD]
MNKHMKFKILTLFTIIGILILATGCSNKSGNGEVSTVRIGLFPNITHAQGLLGKENGAFQKALGETKIDWKIFNAGPSEIEALLADEIDIGYIGPGPAINGFAKSNGAIKIISGAANGGEVLVSRKDLKIDDVKGLSGKKVAVPQFGNTQDLTLRHLLNEYGLKDTTKGGTVEIRQAENPDIETLMGKGDIDAALVPEPWGSILIKEINANVVLDYDKILRGGDYSTTVVVVRTQFLKEHPDIVEEFLKAHVQLTDYINKNKSEAYTSINKEIYELTKKPLPNDILNTSFNRLKVTVDPEKSSINDYINLSKEAGFLKNDVDVNKMIDTSLLNKILGNIK